MDNLYLVLSSMEMIDLVLFFFTLHPWVGVAAVLLSFNYVYFKH